MRLINADTLELEEFYGEDIPKYAILSTHGMAEKLPGYAKIVETCRLALEEGLKYAWVDTCCIDKSSSAELSEAINSMFAWYERAVVCFAFLSDLVAEGKTVGTYMEESLRKSICNSRWFTRGWTLQELLAPSAVVFYSRDWIRLGDKSSTLTWLISDITGIDTFYLWGHDPISDASVSLRMFWLSQRKTTRVEDMAYCMLGIFDINMPLLYGEGAKAFVRLQEEIIKVSVDHTIFCWSWTVTVPPAWTSLIAPSPDTFKHSKDFRRASADEKASPYSMTNVGLSIRLPIIHAWSYNFIVLMVRHRNSVQYHHRVCIPIQSLLPSSTSDVASTYMRIPYPPDPIFAPISWVSAKINMFVVSRIISGVHEKRSFPYTSTPRDLLITTGATLTRTHFDEDGAEFDGRLVETHPRYLFDGTRSVFRLTHRVENGWNGILVLANKGFGCGIFVSCKTDMAKRTRWFCHILPLYSSAEYIAELPKLLEVLESQVTSMTGQDEIRTAVCPDIQGYFVIDGYEDDIDNEDERRIVPARLELGLTSERIMELSKGIEKSLHVKKPWSIDSDP